MQIDAIVIGGSFAGLSAATYIARARRSVAVIDAGLPRNRFAEHSHGFLGQDGSAPADMLARARAQVAAYPTVRLIAGTATSAEKTDKGFTVTLDSGDVLEARRLVLAFGISDQLPALPGLAERWGKSVIHCPYCHGFEFSDKRLGVLALAPHAVHHALLIPEWGPTTFFLNGQPMPDAETLAAITAKGVALETERPVALHGTSTTLSEVELADGRRVAIDALYIGPQARLNSPIADQLGCAMDDVPWGRKIRVDAMQMTSIPNVFAAGDITRGAHSVTWACADGVMAGTALHRSLIF